MAGYGIDPNDQEHATLETDVTNYLESIGYVVDSAPYHDKMDNRIVSVLQNIYTPTALYLRGRADRVAVKRTPPVVFEWEAKTHKSSSRHDCCIEALPICTHLIKHSTLGIRCLYVYRDPLTGYNKGFWVGQMPTPRIILIPPRWNRRQKNYFKSVFEICLPSTNVKEIKKHTKGTDDPFLIINESQIKTLSHWKALIDDAENI